MFEIRWLQQAEALQPEALRFPIDRTARPRRSRLSRRNGDGCPPSRRNVMRLAHVIIKLKRRRNLVEFLLANKARMSFAWRAQEAPPGERKGAAGRAEAAVRRDVFDPALWRLALGVRSPCFCQTLARARPESIKETLTIIVAL